MAKKIKFPLEMKDEIMVRSIEELRKNFDLEKIVTYLLNGKLMTWVKDRNYENEADELGRLSLDSKDLEKDICKIFDVEYIENNISIEKLKLQDERLSKLKQYTDDEEIINNVDCVAFDNYELMQLLDENTSTIYLAGDEFTLSLDINNKKFIGVQNPIVIINSKELINFKEKEVIFENIRFNEEYCEIVKAKKIEDGNSTKKKKHEYKTSGLLDFMLNDEDRKASRRYFNILQEEMLNIEFDIDKQSRPLLSILQRADLFSKFDINIYGKSLNRILKDAQLNNKFKEYKNIL